MDEASNVSISPATNPTLGTMVNAGPHEVAEVAAIPMME